MSQAVSDLRVLTQLLDREEAALRLQNNPNRAFYEALILKGHSLLDEAVKQEQELWDKAHAKPRVRFIGEEDEH